MISDAQLGPSVLASLATFCGHFVSGRFPILLAPFYSGATLIPLKKKDGGVRPMAVGDLIRRLACKLVLARVKSDLLPMFLPNQLGVGCPNGAEAIAHSLASSIEDLPPSSCILQVDFQNAFNLVSRTAMITLVREYFPSLSNLVEYLYIPVGHLRIGKSSE